MKINTEKITMALDEFEPSFQSCSQFIAACSFCVEDSNLSALKECISQALTHLAAFRAELEKETEPETSTISTMGNVVEGFASDKQPPKKKPGRKKKNIDEGKVIALWNAGWSADEIAVDLNTEESRIEEIIKSRKGDKA